VFLFVTQQRAAVRREEDLVKGQMNASPPTQWRELWNNASHHGVHKIVSDWNKRIGEDNKRLMMMKK
jgi:hypothetical protein